VAFEIIFYEEKSKYTIRAVSGNFNFVVFGFSDYLFFYFSGECSEKERHERAIDRFARI
jgi:hypothetical protein